MKTMWPMLMFRLLKTKHDKKNMMHMTQVSRQNANLGKTCEAYNTFSIDHN